MKIIGIGVDIIENKRIKNSIKNHKFKERIYSLKELKQSTLSKDKIGYFSKRFAAKEAFAKALGTGFRNDLNFKDIEEFNIGHFIIGESIFIGLSSVIKKFKKIIKN